MDELIIVLSCGKPYNFTPEGSDQTLSGCTMHYIPTGDINQKNEVDGVLGYQPLKESMPVSFYDRVKEIGLPAVAKAHYYLKNTNGKQTLAINGLDFVAELETAKGSKNKEG